MIERLPSGTIVTQNQVTNKPVKYSGPILSALLEYLEAYGRTVRITAWDEYIAELDAQVIRDFGVLLATHADGKLLTIEDQGPFFVIFPFDENQSLQKDLYYSQSVWQVKSIEIE